MHSQAARWQVAAALGVVYVVWGSTYLAMRFAVETLPPFAMGAARFLVAGTLLYAWLRARGAPRPTAAQWRQQAGLGLLLLVGGTGMVGVAEQWIPSSLAALIVTAVPLFLVLLEWIGDGCRPTLPVALGLVAGFAGVVLLVDPGAAAVDDASLWPALLTLLASLSWAVGSWRAGKAAPVPAASAMQMLVGGAGLLLLSLASGEAGRLAPGTISLRSALALAYLIGFGSLLAFTCYLWLLRNVRPAIVGTYAYVNPAVAVLLGWALAGEAIGPRTLAAAALIIGAVGLITRARTRPAPAPAAPLASGDLRA